MQATDFVVARNDLQQCKSIETHLPDADALPADTLLVKVDRFAFTANNISYAVLGDELKYWQLFPAPKDFGNIPVWGFGDVIASKHPGVAEGERLFGYFPMATHLVIEAGEVSKRGLRDVAAHRQGVAPVYNTYARISGDPAFAGRQGDYQALLRPLFMLSFLVDDFLAENDFFGARSVMLSSASSKTAIGLAHLLHSAQGHPGGRPDFGGQCRLCRLARLLRRGRDLRAGDLAAIDFADSLRRHGGQQRTARPAASPFRRGNEIFRAHRADAPQLIAGRAGAAGRQANLVLRPRPDSQTRQGMGPRRRRHALLRRVVGLRAKTGRMARGDRGPRAQGRAAGLSRYARRTYSAGSGAYAVADGVRRFLRDDEGYSVAIRERPLDKTAGEEVAHA
jgi:hypothetical protein